MYLVIAIAGLGIAWVIMKKSQLSRLVLDCRDQSYLSVFETTTLASERGKVASELCSDNPRIANDRDFFVNVCFNSGVKPELAASAWVNRALDARYR